jgi:predicted aspartyl protease
MSFVTVPIGAAGPLVEVHVALSTPRIDALKAKGRTWPPPVPAKALVDTGSSLTTVSPRIATVLGLIPTGQIDVNSATTGQTPRPCYLYDVCLAFVRPTLIVLGATIPVAEVELANPDIDMLLGRDMLAQCLCVYDGRAGAFTLAW